MLPNYRNTWPKTAMYTTSSPPTSNTGSCSPTSRRLTETSWWSCDGPRRWPSSLAAGRPQAHLVGALIYDTGHAWTEIHPVYGFCVEGGSCYTSGPQYGGTPREGTGNSRAPVTQEKLVAPRPASSAPDMKASYQPTKK